MRKTMISKNDPFSIVKQCNLLSIARSSVYNKKMISKRNLNLMRYIDIIYTDNPTYGTRRISKALTKRYKLKAGRIKVRNLMNKMGIQAIYPKKYLTIANKEHKKYPYLLRDLIVNRVNQVWSTDITYIRLKGGFVYLTVIVDWYSRYVLAWDLSTSMDSAFCCNVLKEALSKYDKPEIFNTDQGSQYTSDAFINILKENKIKISMDGKGRALDNVFVERLWRTVKYEDIFLKDYATVQECRQGLKEFFQKYNTRREHQSLDYNYPEEVYLKKIILNKVA